MWGSKGRGKNVRTGREDRLEEACMGESGKRRRLGESERARGKKTKGQEGMAQYWRGGDNALENRKKDPGGWDKLGTIPKVTKQLKAKLHTQKKLTVRVRIQRGTESGKRNEGMLAEVTRGLGV